MTVIFAIILNTVKRISDTLTLTGIGLNSYYYNMIAFKTNILFPSLMLGRQSITLTGSACDFVDFGAASSSGSGCVDGTKMVLKSA